LMSCALHCPQHDQLCMNTYIDTDLDIFGLLQTLIQVSHGSKNSQPRMDSTLCVVLVGNRITKIYQEPIPQELSNVTVIAANHLRTGGLVCTDHVPVVFGIELAGECGGVHEVTKHHRELTAFSFGCTGGHDRRCSLDRGCVLGRSRWN